MPGGSSGGSAAAVAADETILALGSDTGGSVRQPASYCGVVGLKPTYGRVSRYGLIAYASSLDQIGPVTKDVEDAALLLQAIAGHDSRDSTSSTAPVPDYRAALKGDIRGLRVGLAREHFPAALDAEVAGAAQDAANALVDAGAELVDVELPIAGHPEYCISTYYIIAMAEASANLARYDGVKYGYRAEGHADLQELYLQTRSEGFGTEVKRRIMLGAYALSAGYYDAYYRKAQQVRTLIREDFARAFAACDVLISPVAPTTAFRLGEQLDDPLQMYLNDIYTVSVNLAGLPAISVPFAHSDLPLAYNYWPRPSKKPACCAQPTPSNKLPPEIVHTGDQTMKYCALAACILLSTLTPAAAINPNAGTTGFNFLKIGVGTRAAALGGAYAAVSGNIEASAWNPAGLFGLSERTAALAYNSYFVDSQAGFASIAAPKGSRVHALSVHYVSYGDLWHTDAKGRDLGTFSATDLAAYLSIAQQLGADWLAVGANLKSRLFKYRRVFFRRLSRRSRPSRSRPDRGHDPRRSHRQSRFCALGLHRGLQGLATGTHPAGHGPSPRAHAGARALGGRFQLAQRQRLLPSLRP